MLRRIEIALDGTFHVQVIGGAGDFQVTFGFNSFLAQQTKEFL